MYKFYFIKHHKMRNKFLEELKPAAFRKKNKQALFSSLNLHYLCKRKNEE